MSNYKYCSCGAKTIIESSIPKFCSICGKSFAAVVQAIAPPQKRTIVQSSRAQVVRKNELMFEEEAEPMGFTIPNKFEYETEKYNQKLTIKDIASVPPDASRRRPEIKSNRKSMSLKEFANESMKECSSARSKEIVIDGQ